MDTLKTNTALVVSPPSKPADPALIKKISALLGDLEEVREAHLPDVIEIGMSTKSTPMLFVVVASADHTKKVERALARRFGGLFRLGSRLAYRVVQPDFPMLADIRDTQSLVGWRD